MVIWFIVGLSIVCVWIWSLLFMSSASKGGRRIRGYKKKLYPKHKVDSQNTKNSIKEEVKESQLILHS